MQIEGKDVREYSLEELRGKIGMVLQKAVLFKGTIRENMLWGNENATDEDIMQALEVAQAKEFVDKKEGGLDFEIEQGGKNLSGGQRQRVSIARALMRNPEVIVLDEATSALDSISEKLIQEALNNLTKDRTTFIVAHRLSTIKGADRIAVIADGHCVEYGTYDELMELKGEFYQMKSIQS